MAVKPAGRGSGVRDSGRGGLTADSLRLAVHYNEPRDMGSKMDVGRAEPATATCELGTGNSRPQGAWLALMAGETPPRWLGRGLKCLTVSPARMPSTSRSGGPDN
jgi:hypothetical protein